MSPIPILPLLVHRRDLLPADLTLTKRGVGLNSLASWGLIQSSVSCLEAALSYMAESILLRTVIAARAQCSVLHFSQAPPVSGLFLTHTPYSEWPEEGGIKPQLLV